MGERTKFMHTVQGVGRRVLHRWGTTMSRYSRHGDHPFFESSEFSWIPPLEERWKEIRAEVETLLEWREQLPDFQQISKDQAHLAKPNEWKTFFLYGYGYRADSNCERCPQTTQLVESIPGMKTAFFSILAPGTHIPAHCGPYKGLLRYHMGLIIPDPAKIRIRVDRETRHWEEGKSLVFDDTYEHEVWNDTNQERVILFVDFVRPLPKVLDWLNRSLVKLVAMSPLVQEGRKNFERFSEQMAAVEKAMEKHAQAPGQK